jgi:hypothetical protein
VFYIDIAKVDWGPVTMATYVCFKYILEIFYLFQTYAYVASVPSGCLHMFAMATNVFSSFFLVFCKCFKHMLQVFQLFRTYVTSVFV